MSPKIVDEIILNNQKSSSANENLACFHCGDLCRDNSIHINEKIFCCNGCKAVYQLLNDVEMCDYYAYNENAGVKPEESEVPERFAYLDDDEIKSLAENLKHYLTIQRW